MTRHIENIFINSINASQINDSNSRIRIDLSNPINLPVGERVICEAVSSSIWFDNDNIITGVNDIVNVTINGTAYSWTFPPGLYSISALQETLNEFLINSIPSLPANTISLAPDLATGKVSMKVTYTTITWNFEVGNTLFKTVMGFTGTYTALSDIWFESTNKAAFNNLQRYMFFCSFCTGGYINTQSGQQICHIQDIPADTAVGSQLIEKPNNTIKSVVHERSIDSLTVWITKEDGETLIKTYEPWTLHLRLYIE